MAGVPAVVWGENLGPKDWTFQRVWDWPDEPSPDHGGDRLHELSGSITRIEKEEKLTEEELKQRVQDRAMWEAEGQTWRGAFLTSGWQKIDTYMRATRRTNDAVAKPNASGVTKRFEKVDDLCILQSDRRPGARSKLWD